MPDRPDIRELHNREALPDAVFNMQQGSTARKRAAENIRAQQQLDNPRSVTESLNPEPPTLESLHYAIQKNIGADKSTGVPVRSPEQQDRVNRANAAVELAHTVLEKGYANLTEGQKRQVRERILPEMQRLWPSINDAFGTMSRNERLRAMDDILMDPAFAQNLKTIIEELRTKEVKGNGGEKSAYEAAKAEYEKKEVEQRNIHRQYRDTVNHLNEFNPAGDKGRQLANLDPLPVLQSDLDSVKTEITTLEGEKKSLEQEISQVNRQLDRIRGGDPALEGRLTNLQSRLSSKESDLRTKKSDEQSINQKINRRKELEKEKEDAEKEERTEWLAKETIDREVRDLYEKMLIAQADRDLAKLGRGADEEKFVQDFQRSFANAAEKVVRERIEQMEPAQKSVSHETSESAIHKGLEKRWVNAGGKLDKKAIRRDYERLIRDQLDEVVKDTLLEQGGMRTRRDVEHKLETDKEYAKKAREKTAEKILSRYLQTGGKLKPDEARKIADSELGTEIAIQAFENNKSLNEKLDEYKEKNMLPKEWNWKVAFSRLPKADKRQLVKAGLVVAGIGVGTFFAAPFIIPIIDRVFDWGVENWKDYVKTGDFPDAVDAARENVGNAVETVREEINEFGNEVEASEPSNPGND